MDTEFRDASKNPLANVPWLRIFDGAHGTRLGNGESLTRICDFPFKPDEQIEKFDMIVIVWYRPDCFPYYTADLKRSRSSRTQPICGISSTGRLPVRLCFYRSNCGRLRTGGRYSRKTRQQRNIRTLRFKAPSANFAAAMPAAEPHSQLSKTDPTRTEPRSRIPSPSRCWLPGAKAWSNR
jgi:hypothetical protein